MTETPTKPLKSSLLAETIAEFKAKDRADQKRWAPIYKRLLATAARYPNGRRPELFCWLWNNHAQVVELRERLLWEGIAILAEEDGIKGRWGAPPTANSIRRVWHRVCREKAEREARLAARAVEERDSKGR